MLSIESEQSKSVGTLVVRLRGEAGMADADQLEHALDQGGAKTAKRVIFDCSELTFLASLSLGTLMHFQSEVRRGGGRVCFAAVQPQVKTMFQRAHLLQLCDLHDTVEAAVIDS